MTTRPDAGVRRINGEAGACEKNSAAIARLAAIAEIKLLKARRDRAADTKDWALYELLHAPDHHFYDGDYPPWITAAEMIANVRQIMADFTTLHHSHLPEITFASDVRRTASGR